MRFKSFLLIALVMVVGQSVQAAVLTIYNKSNNSVQGYVEYGTTKPQTKNFGIDAGGKAIIDSGLHSFNEIEWQEIVKDPKHRLVKIPSKRMMLLGTFTIKPNLDYEKNF